MDILSFVKQQRLREKLDGVETQCEKLGNSIVVGKYTGNGQSTRTVNLGHTPIAVIVMSDNGEVCQVSETGKYYNGGIAFTNSPVKTVINGTTYNVLEIVENGFQVRKIDYQDDDVHDAIQTNDSDATFHYIAFFNDIINLSNS